MNKTVVCYIFDKDNNCLMLYRNKKKNDLNEGKYIGIGGHVLDNESLIDAVKRETKEETNLDLLEINYCGKVIFNNINKLDEYQEEMYVYKSNNYSGEVSNCNEGTLYWMDWSKILDLPLWEGDRYFIELMNENIIDFEIVLNYIDKKFINCVRIK